MTLKNYLKNKKILEEANVSITDHDACGVGFVASMTGKPKREVVENGIEALKAVWHRGAVDADGKTGDGAGIPRLPKTGERAKELFGVRKSHVAQLY